MKTSGKRIGFLIACLLCGLSFSACGGIENQSSEKVNEGSSVEVSVSQDSTESLKESFQESLESSAEESSKESIVSSSEESLEDVLESRSEESSEESMESSAEESSVEDDFSGEELPKEEEGRIPSKGLLYKLSEDGTYYTVADLGACDDEHVVIPSTYRGKPVKEIGINAFSWCGWIQSVFIPASIEGMATHTVICCPLLTEFIVSENNAVYRSIDGNLYSKDGTVLVQYAPGKKAETFDIPNHVTKIDGSAFAFSYHLKSMEVGGSVTEIGELAFSGSSALESIRIQAPITTIPTFAFQGCIGLKEVEIADSVTTIEKSAFNSENEVTELILPDSVTEIGSYALSGFSKLKSFTLPKGVTTLNNFFGHGTWELETLTIGENVQKIDGTRFYQLPNLKEFVVSEDNEYFKSIDGVLYSKDGGELLAYPCGKTEDSFVIPEEVVGIGYHAFYECDSLRAITIGANVERIDGSAFYRCDSLRYLTVGENVEEIAEGAFDTCRSLVEIYNKSALDIQTGEDTHGEIAKWAIHVYKEEDGSLITKDENGCVLYQNGADKVLIKYEGTDDAPILPEDLTGIDARAFMNCTTVKNVNLPDTVKRIGTEAFTGCTALEFVYIGKGVLAIQGRGLQTKSFTNSYKEYLFAGCTSLKEINVSAENTVYQSIDGNLYNKDGTKLIRYACGNERTEYALPEGVTHVTGHAFKDCVNLKKIVLPDTISNISLRAFEGCSSLCSIELPETVTSIGSSAFAGCSSLSSINIPESVTDISIGAFKDCVSLTEIVVPASVTSISSSAFDGCSSLRSARLYCNADVELGMFDECFYLEAVLIGSSVLSVDDNIVMLFAREPLIGKLFYQGTESEWGQVCKELLHHVHPSEVYYYSETKPETEGKYWYFDANGDPCVWAEA